MMKKMMALALAFAFSGAAAAEAGKLMSKQAAALHVTNRTGAAQSTVVGSTQNRSAYYVHSEGTKGGEKYVKVRLVSRESGKILSTSKNLLPGIKQAAALKNRNGAKGGQGGDFGYTIRTNRNAMTSAGNIKISVDNSGFPGRTEGRLVTLTKTGAIKQISDSATDGKKSRW